MSDHPPIPPNCPLIQEYGDGSMYLLYGNRQYGCKFDSDTRTIIASLAQCAWLDEAQRIRASRANYYDDMYDLHGLEDEALENAEDWLDWREQK